MYLKGSVIIWLRARRINMVGSVRSRHMPSIQSWQPFYVNIFSSFIAFLIISIGEYIFSGESADQSGLWYYLGHQEGVDKQLSLDWSV
jgi:hypothetical protein